MGKSQASSVGQNDRWERRVHQEIAQVLLGASPVDHNGLGKPLEAPIAHASFDVDWLDESCFRLEMARDFLAPPHTLVFLQNGAEHLNPEPLSRGCPLDKLLLIPASLLQIESFLTTNWLTNYT